jgi:hypothetical protein
MALRFSAPFLPYDSRLLLPDASAIPPHRALQRPASDSDTILARFTAPTGAAGTP